MTQQHAPRQMQRQPQKIDYEKVSREVLSGIERNRPILEPLLPAGTSWARLHASIATLLTQNPGIMKCTVPSIIRGCMKAAYDGLVLDGREAALVPSNNKYGRPPNEITKTEARYNPMVAGLRKQIIQGGLVDDVTTTCVYKGEPYKVIRGSDPRIEHEEILSKRGKGREIVAVYSMAFLKNGRTSFETMSKAQIDAVRELAQTKDVWSKNEDEMTRKTVLRRHRKSLPGAAEIRDAEMEVLFPHMNPANATHQMLPAPERPDRRDFQPAQPALEDQSQNIFTNFDNKTGEIFDERDAAPVEQERTETARAKPAARAKAESKPEAARQQDSEDPAPAAEKAKADPPAEKVKDEPKPKVMVPSSPPTDDGGWRYYADTVKTALPEVPDVDALNRERRAHQPMIDAAPKAVQDELTEAFADALVDLVSK